MPSATHPAHVEIKLLRLFDVLYTTHSLTRAAVELDQKQPTLSIWLARLRTQFHDPLFVRTPEGMQPTAHAEALIGLVREVVNLSQRLAEWHPDFDPAQADYAFRVAMTDASHITLLPRLLEALCRAAPAIEIEIARLDADTPAALREGRVHLAIGGIADLQAGFYQQTLFTQDWVCLVRRDHPVIRDRLDRDTYQRADHVDVLGGMRQRLLVEAVAGEGMVRPIRLVLPGYPGLSRVLAVTDLVATLPRHIGRTLAEDRNLRLLACPFPIPTFPTCQYWHARYHHDAANRWLRTLSAAVLGGVCRPDDRTAPESDG
jgi:DNA-binding transcriptional LysR family regulator